MTDRPNAVTPGLNVDFRQGTSIVSSYGAFIGTFIGTFIGSSIGAFIGTIIGSSYGVFIGTSIGSSFGAFIGTFIGTSIGLAREIIRRPSHEDFIKPREEQREQGRIQYTKQSISRS